MTIEILSMFTACAISITNAIIIPLLAFHSRIFMSVKFPITTMLSAARLTITIVVSPIPPLSNICIREQSSFDPKCNAILFPITIAVSSIPFLESIYVRMKSSFNSICTALSLTFSIAVSTILFL